MKCPICGVEVETTLWRPHREASHPDYVQWVRHKLGLTIYVIIPSWAALIVVDALFGRFLAPGFLFLGVVTYAHCRIRVRNINCGILSRKQEDTRA